MIIKGIISEDHINYKKISTTIIFPYCNGFKCGNGYCQNSSLYNEPNIDLNIGDIVERYINNPITEAIVMQGLEPFDSWDDLYNFVKELRSKTQDDIVIYTGYYKDEIVEYVEKLKTFSNIIVKFGRYVPNQEKHYDDVLGVYLASDNQYAEKVS